MFIAMALVIANPAIFVCSSPAVTDGRTLRCPGSPEMRLARIDVPVLDFRCTHGERPGFSDRCARGEGLASRDHLRSLVRGRLVTCALVDASWSEPGFQRADEQGEVFVTCSTSGVGDLGEAMMDAGHALWRRP